MNKKSGRILHIALFTILVFAATFVISRNSNILASNKSISSVSNNGYGADKNEVSNKSDLTKDLTTAEQEVATPAPSPDPAAALPTPAPNMTITASSSNEAANRTAKAPSSTPSGTKTQKVAASPKPTPKPAVYTISNNGTSYSVSAEERNLFARLVSAEAIGESYDGKLAVATVVVNRVTSGVFPGSVTQVIMGQEGGYYQFTPVLDGRINNPPSSDALKAVDQVLGGYRSFSAKIMWFLNPQKSTSGWIIKNKTYFKTIGNHDFYY